MREFRVGDWAIHTNGRGLISEMHLGTQRAFIEGTGWQDAKDLTLIPTHEDVVEAFEGLDEGLRTQLSWNSVLGYSFKSPMGEGHGMSTQKIYDFFMKNQIDKEALKAEKAELEKKLAEINEKLGE